jgi:hypothetical protein
MKDISHLVQTDLQRFILIKDYLIGWHKVFFI